MKGFVAYPTLNEKIISKLAYNASDKFIFRRTNNGKLDEIKVNYSYKNVYFEDYKSWLYKRDDLHITKDIKFNPKSLFGQDGLVSSFATIGIAISWKSNKSMRRGVKKIGTFNFNDYKVNEKVHLYFKSKEIKDSVDVEIILYVSEPSKVNLSEESHLINLKGAILGVIDSIHLSFVGLGSSFPTSSINSPNEPLWKLNVEMDLFESVTNTVELIVNEGHYKFSLLDSKHVNFNSDLLEEIMISIVYQLIILSLNDIKVYSEEEFEEGTLGNLIKYYYKTFKLEINNENNFYKLISLGIRK